MVALPVMGIRLVWLAVIAPSRYRSFDEMNAGKCTFTSKRSVNQRSSKIG